MNREDSPSRMRQSAANCPQHTGAIALVRDALNRAGRPLSLYAISIAAGIKTERVKRAINGAMNFGGSGGIYRINGANGVTYYTTIRPEQRQEVRLTRAGSGQIAGPITIGRGSVWGYRTGGQLV